MQDVRRYMLELFGFESRIQRLSAQELAHVPLYLQTNFELYAGSVAGQKVVWAKVLTQQELTTQQLNKQKEQLQHALRVLIVFVFDQLDSWQRKRLLEKRIAFIQPFKQLYIPELLLQLNDMVRYDHWKDQLSDKLTPSAQLALLYHLQLESLAHRSFQEIASVLHYSPMTVSRVVKEFKDHKLASVSGLKEKALQFHEKGKSLWEKALPLLRSPVSEVLYTDHILENSRLPIAGDTALSDYTMLAAGGQLSLAAGKEEAQAMKASGWFPATASKEGRHRIEVWSYSPQTLSSGGPVDRLSLYLSMQEDTDERVLRALNDLLNQLPWYTG